MHLFPGEEQTPPFGQGTNEAGFAQGVGGQGRKGTFAGFAPGSQEIRWGSGKSEVQLWL